MEFELRGQMLVLSWNSRESLVPGKGMLVERSIGLEPRDPGSHVRGCCVVCLCRCVIMTRVDTLVVGRGSTLVSKGQTDAINR